MADYNNSHNDYTPLSERGKGNWQKIAYENLANAIIEVACKDYVSLGSQAIRSKYIASEHSLTGKNELVRFFYSQWFRELTNLDPDYLIAELDKEILEREKKEIPTKPQVKELTVKEKIQKFKKEKALLQKHEDEEKERRKQEDERIKKELNSNAKKMLGLWQDY